MEEIEWEAFVEDCSRGFVSLLEEEDVTVVVVVVVKEEEEEGRETC